ncbi:MAG: Oligoendopeptidase F, plasmid [Chlamydiae bacterium]|nr:Oligoendopeptidase F, plasmid [Chlamydiota bacterium]
MSTTAEKTKNRKEIDPQDQWNVEALFSSFPDWEGAFTKIAPSSSAPRWPDLASFRGRLHEGTDALKQALETLFSLSRELEKLHTYAHLRHDEDITHDSHKSSYLRILSLYSDFQQESSWFEPELLALPSETIDSYLQSPSLAPYRFYIEKIVRRRPHTLSAEKEELLAMAGKPIQTAPKAFSALSNADIRFETIEDQEGKPHELSHGLYQLYLRSPDRVLRKNAFKQMHAQFSYHENTLAELLYGQVQAHIFEARTRNYPSSLEAALFGKKIPKEVYSSLIDTVRKGLPSLHRYVSLRKKLLKLPEIHLYDMYVPLVEAADRKIEYAQAEELVIESARPLGEEYQQILQKGLKEQRWVDRYENKHKRSGAYSSGCFDSFPYILMNFRGTLRDTFTLAHEAGHSMHSYLSHRSQPYHYSHYPIFVAEVASTFNEELLMELLLARTENTQERLYLIHEKIEDIRATFFRQTMFAEFELKIHELVEQNTPLTPTLLSDLYLELNRDYFGEEATLDEEVAIEWARIPHFYYNFYVYQYATGISAALSLAENVLKGTPQARENYFTFLKGGSSLFPIDLLKIAGIDVTVPAPIEATLRKFDSLVSELESLSNTG